MNGSVVVEKTVKRERQSNFELLRIVAMVMIVAHHFSYHGGFVWEPQSSLLNILWIDSLLPVGKIGVDIFVLISGYFLSKSSKLTVKKIAKFWGQIFFYSVFIYVLFVLLNKEAWSTATFFNSFFPLIREDWWFASTYFIMLLLSPLLNIIINAISKRQHIIILIGGFVFWSVIPTFLAYKCGYNSALWFIYLYFVSAYIRKYADGVEFSSIKCLIAAFVFWLASFLLELVFPGIFVVFPKFFSHDMNTVFVLLCSLMMFLAFKSMNIKSNKIINTISSATFGVYLIHDSNLMRGVLWNDVFRNSDYRNANILIPYTVFAVICVFAAASLIDLIRINTVEKGFMKLVDKAEPKIKKSADALLSTIVRLVKQCEALLEKKNKRIKNIDKQT